MAIRGTAVTSQISAPTEKAEVIQILDNSVNRSLVSITGNGCSLKQTLSAIKRRELLFDSELFTLKLSFSFL